MSRALGVAAPACLGELQLTTDGALEGWCWYPDQPHERATVELLRNGEVVRAVRATRLRPDRRELGMGDGYCGFWFPLGSQASPAGDSVVFEARERRLTQVIGRVMLGNADPARDRRLAEASAALTRMAASLDALGRAPDLATPLQELAGTLFHVATARPRGEESAEFPGLGACLEQIATIPPADLGWSSAPDLTVILPPPEGDVASVAAAMWTASLALEDLGTEFILLDDGVVPLTALLPTRLRHLKLIRIDADTAEGRQLNAAASMARGKFLAFARPGGPSPAGLAQAARNAQPGIVGLDAATTGVSGPVAVCAELHGLHCIVSRGNFAEMGGFDPTLAGHAMWADLIDKAGALGIAVKSWTSPRSARRVGSEGTVHA